MPRPIKNLKSLLASRRMFANGGEVYGGPSGILASSQPLMEAARRPVMPRPQIGPRTPWGPQGGGNVQGSVNQASGTLGTAQDQLRQAARQVGGIRNTLGPGGQQGGFPRPRPGGFGGIFGGGALSAALGAASDIFKPPSPMPMAQGGVARLQDGGLPFRFSEDAMRRFKTLDPGYLESLTVKGPTPKRRLPPPGTGPISLEPTTPPLDRGGDAPRPEIMQTNLAQSIIGNYPGMTTDQVQEIVFNKQTTPESSIDDIMSTFYTTDEILALRQGISTETQTLTPEGDIIKDADLEAVLSGKKDLADISMNFTLDPDGNIIRKDIIDPMGKELTLPPESGGDTTIVEPEKETIVQEAIKTMVAPDGTGVESFEDNAVIPVTDTTDQAKAPVLTRRSDLFAALTRRGPDAVNADEDVKATAVGDVVARGLKKGAGDDTIDIGKLKSDIEALMPAVKDDPETEGLLLMMLGAAIGGGKSPDAWTNVFAGVEKALPSLINYRAKQTEAKRARQMGIAKMAITQKLSLEAEQRAETRGIRKEERGVTRTIATEKRARENKFLEVDDYVVLENTTVPANLLKEGAKGSVKIPALTMLPLDTYGRRRMSEFGIKVAPMGKSFITYKDILAANNKTPSLDDQLTAGKVANQQGERVMSPYAPFKKWGVDSKYEYYAPKPAGWLSGKMPKNIILKGGLKSLDTSFRRASGKIGDLYNRVQGLKRFLPKEGEQSKLTGLGGVKERIGDALKGLASGNESIDRFAALMLEGEDASKVSQFEAEGRIILAQLAPIILQESGKTISDADRIRVAKTLGFKVDTVKNDDGSISFVGISGFNENVFRNPQTIINAINATSQALATSYGEIQEAYQTELDKFEIGDLKGLTQEEKKAFSPGSRKKPALFKYDLTQPLGKRYGTR